jgi:hypothetical protein
MPLAFVYESFIVLQVAPQEKSIKFIEALGGRHVELVSTFPVVKVIG